jgi:hypothetical protein
MSKVTTTITKTGWVRVSLYGKDFDAMVIEQDYTLDGWSGDPLALVLVRHGLNVVAVAVPLELIIAAIDPPEKVDRELIGLGVSMRHEAANRRARIAAGVTQ